MNRRVRLAWVWLLPLVVWFWPTHAFAQAAVPTLSRPVTDLANVLSASAEAELNDLLRVHHGDGHAQIAVLTIDSTQGEPIDDYSLRVATRWAGGRAGANDGILVVIAVQDRRMRIELGYGAETLITDAQARKMLDDVRPRMRNGDYDGAAREICGRLIGRTGGVVPQGYVPPPPPPEPPIPAPWGFLGLFLLGSLFGAVGWSRHVQRAASSEDESEEDSAGEEADLDWAREPSLMDLLKRPTFLAALGVAAAVSAFAGYVMGWGAAFALCGLVGAIAGWRFLFKSITSLGHLAIVFVIAFTTFAVLPEIALYLSSFGALLLGLIHASSISGGGGGGSWGGFSGSLRDESYWNPSSSSGSASFWSSSSSSSDSGSLWSSSSSSSDSSSSSIWDSGSSSSGSSDYSGGGGSFGGGGASSSW